MTANKPHWVCTHVAPRLFILSLVRILVILTFIIPFVRNEHGRGTQDCKIVKCMFISVFLESLKEGERRRGGDKKVDRHKIMYNKYKWTGEVRKKKYTD